MGGGLLAFMSIGACCLACTRVTVLIHILKSCWHACAIVRLCVYTCVYASALKCAIFYKA